MRIPRYFTVLHEVIALSPNNKDGMHALLGLKQTVREAATICPAPVTLTFDCLTLKVVSESCVT